MLEVVPELVPSFVFISCIHTSRVFRSWRRKCIDRNKQSDDFCVDWSNKSWPFYLRLWLHDELWRLAVPKVRPPQFFGGENHTSQGLPEDSQPHFPAKFTKFLVVLFHFLWGNQPPAIPKSAPQLGRLAQTVVRPVWKLLLLTLRLHHWSRDAGIYMDLPPPKSEAC